MSWPHTPPDEEYIKRNALKEPEGERIRKELIEFLERNKIVGILLDTATHTVEVNVGKLPDRLKTVLTKYGAISVVDDTPDCEGCGQGGGYHASFCSKAWAPPTRPAGWDDNAIPPMMHPSSKYWEQPALSEIKIDAQRAYMSRATFDELAEYSTSVPSGVYEGKMWKARILLLLPSNELTPVLRWHLRWYGYSKSGTGYVSNHQRVIELTDGDLPK